MHTAEEYISNMNKPAEVKGGKNCCSNCRAKSPVQNAHCGSVFTIKRGLLEKTSFNQYDQTNSWQPDTLMTFIIREFHDSFYNEEPLISTLLEKALNSTDTNYPVLQNLERLFRNLKTKVTTHFLVEENVLFPYITNMLTSKKEHSKMVTRGLKTLYSSVNVMETEHDEIEEILREIKETANHYTPHDEPEISGILYQKLRQMHANLQQHIYLENNNLYPNSLLLQKELIKLGL